VPSESKTKRTAAQKNHPRVHGCAQGDYAGQGTRQGAGCRAETNGQVFSGGKTKSKSFTTTTKSTPDGALKSPIFKSAAVLKSINQREVKIMGKYSVLAVAIIIIASGPAWASKIIGNGHCVIDYDWNASNFFVQKAEIDAAGTKKSEAAAKIIGNGYPTEEKAAVAAAQMPDCK
jgi:hypothetical protein